MMTRDKRWPMAAWIVAGIIAFTASGAIATAQTQNVADTQIDLRNKSREEKLRLLDDLMRSLGYKIPVVSEDGLPRSALESALPKARIPKLALEPVQTPKFEIRSIPEPPPAAAAAPEFMPQTGGLDRLRDNQRFLRDQEIGRIIQVE